MGLVAETLPDNLVTIMLPVYQAEPYLAETIASIEAQEYTGFRCICVDDGSTDRSYEMLKAWEARDPRITVSHNETNLGIFPTRNAMLERVTTPWISVMDADDYYLPGLLRTQLEYLNEHPDIDILGTAIKIFFDDRSQLFTPVWIPGSIRDGVQPAAHSTFIIRTGHLRAISGYDQNFRLSGDHEMLSRLYHHGSQFHVLDEPLVYIRRHGGNITLRKRRQQLLHTLKIYWRMMFVQKVRLSRKGYWRVCVVLAEYLFRFARLDTVVPASLIRKILRRTPVAVDQ